MTTPMTTAAFMSLHRRNFFLFVSVTVAVLMALMLFFSMMTREKFSLYYQPSVPELVGVDLRTTASRSSTRSGDVKDIKQEKDQEDVHKMISFSGLASLDIRGINFLGIGRYTCLQQQQKPLPRYAPVPQGFRPVLNEDERLLLLLTLQTLFRSLESRNLSYFLYGGTLIGSYRHHGLIPWDDDADIMLNNNQKREIKAALSGIANFTLSCNENWTWKFFWSDLPGASDTSIRSPFVDLFFFEENATHIWDRLENYRLDYVFPKGAVFPLVRRPFEGAWLLVPRDAGWVLNKTYDVSLCTSMSWCHKVKERMRESASVPCQHLRQVFPLVSRRRLRQNVVRETLLLGDRVIQSFDFPDLAVSGPLPASDRKNNT